MPKARAVIINLLLSKFILFFEDQISTLTKSHIKTYRIPSVEILIGTSEGIIFQKAYGVHNSRPNQLSTLYDIASITKLFAAAAFMKLVDTKEIKLRTKLKTIFPEVTNEQFQNIDFESLMRHESGYQAIFRNNEWGKDSRRNISKCLSI
jgi:CubicO group peptidase (beta-lactamase class C family)